jgi:hypothetical protein
MSRNRIIIVPLMGVLALLLALVVDGGRRGQAAPPGECPCYDMEDVTTAIAGQPCEVGTRAVRSGDQLEVATLINRLDGLASAFVIMRRVPGDVEYNCLGNFPPAPPNDTIFESAADYVDCQVALEHAAQGADCTRIGPH